MLSKLFFNKHGSCLITTLYYFSTSHAQLKRHSCKLLVIGAGSGGCSLAAKFSKEFEKGQLIIIDPNDIHYYQPMFTFIAVGARKFEDCKRPMQETIPTGATWIKDEVVQFKPEQDMVTVSNGDTIVYEFMVIAAGIQVNYNEIPGLIEALNRPDSGVCSNYDAKYVQLTFKAMQKFKSGNAIFTFPDTAVKCAGAPQKVCYLTEHYFRNVGKRDKANIIYNTSLNNIFGVKPYADVLWKIAKKRNIKVNLRTNLIEVKPDEKVAIFQNLDKPEDKTTIEYSMLHVPPPMGPIDAIKKCLNLVTETGYVKVDKYTLQHITFPNIFAIGDCTCAPTSKTIAAIAAQLPVIQKNLKAAMNGEKLTAKYNGYTACPIVTGFGTCILAEFDYNHKLLETLPIRQTKEMWLPYVLTKDIFPIMYWNVMLKGYWHGPATIRNILHLAFFKSTRTPTIA